MRGKSLVIQPGKGISEKNQLKTCKEACDPHSLKVKLTHVSATRPEKPEVRPTESTPVELIQISGNIRKCAGSRGDLKNGPTSRSMQDVSSLDLDSQYCIRHKEEDYVFIAKTILKSMAHEI